MTSDRSFFWRRLHSLSGIFPDKLFALPPQKTFMGMTETMQEGVLRIVPGLTTWLKELHK